MKSEVTTEDRIWAVLAHLSALVTGIGLPFIVGWAEQKTKIEVRIVPVLAGVGYQSLGYTLWILFTLLVMLVLVFD
jgi:uncharacterized Tic20 family protein